MSPTCRGLGDPKFCPATFQLSGVETSGQSHNPWPKFLFQLLPRAWQQLENPWIWNSKLSACHLEGLEDTPTRLSISHHHATEKVARPQRAIQDAG